MNRLAEVVETALPEGAELIEARFSGGPLLTLLVDREEEPVDHEFCAHVIASISPALDREGYDGLVEVSSQDRPRDRPEQPVGLRYVGREVRVRVAERIEGRRTFTGTILRTMETGFVLKPSGGAEVEVPFGSVTQANLKEDI